MPKETSRKHNTLNINELPPPIGGGEDSDFVYSKTLAKLLRRFVRIAVPDQDEVTFSDIEMLDTLMRYGTITTAAKKCRMSAPYISQRVTAILEQMEQRVAEWEAIARVYEEERQIADLETHLEKLAQRKAELQLQINDQVAIVRGMTMSYAESRSRNCQVYLRECKNKK